MRNRNVLAIVLTAGLLALTSCRQIDVDKLTFACNVDGDCPPDHLCCSGTCVAQEAGCVVIRDASGLDLVTTDRANADRATAADSATADAAAPDAGGTDAASGDAAVSDALVGDTAIGDAASDAATGDAATGDAAPGDSGAGDGAPGDGSSADTASNEDASGPYGDGGPCLTSECFLVPPDSQDECYDGTGVIACTACSADGGPAYCGQPPSWPDQTRGFQCFDVGGARRVCGDLPTAVSGQFVSDSLTLLVWQRTVEPTQTWEHARSLCADSTYAGFTDWRLSSPIELQSLVDDTEFQPDIDSTVFPATPREKNWTSATATGSTSEAWVVDFNDGTTAKHAKTSAARVRCVRGASPRAGITPRWFATDTVNHLVTDQVTGLVWQGQEVASQANTWRQALAFCEMLTQGGASDWRLPSKQELLSLVDYGYQNPASTFTFTAPDINVYWTATTWVANPAYARTVNFATGNLGVGTKTGSFLVRCVRGGP